MDVSVRALLVALFFVSGCTTSASLHDPDSTDYIMVSRGKANAVYSFITGARVDYCKVTKHGIQHVKFLGTIEYDGDSCRITVCAGKCD